jgi:hypothetical protein
MRRDRPLSVLLAAALVAGVVLSAASPASAGEDGDGASGWVDGASDGDGVTGTANDRTPGTEGTEGTTSTGTGGPNCEKSDGTPDYLSYEGLKHTTMEQQRTDIRPEEQRPGVYLHIYCGDERIGFDFFPDEEVEAIDPETLARSVRLTPPNPAIVTSPSETEGLVGIDTWFWLEQWDEARDSATAGTVTVTVYATPSELTIDPGDGTGPLECASPPAAYTPGADPATGCTHVYETAGQFTATATLTYDVGFSSNVGAGGPLTPITTTGTVDVTVRQAQAVVSG